MDMIRVVLLATVMFSLLTISRSCDPLHLNQCEHEFADEVEIPLKYLEAGFTPEVSENNLRITCRAHDRYQNCVRSYTGYCKLKYRIHFEGLKNLFDYICEEGSRAFLKYETCLRDADLEEKVVQCNDHIFILTREDLCNELLNAMDCVREIATEACGKEAADHQVRKEKLFIQPLATEIKCDLDPETDGANIGMIVGIVVSVIFVIIVALAICLCWAKKKNIRRPADQNQMNVITQPGAMAPSYPGSAPPAYDAEYQDPNLMHPDRAPIYENPTYTLPNELGINNNVYTGLPGKE